MSDLTASADEPGLTTAATTPVTGGALGKKGLGWGLFEWARNPYYNVIVISIFTPYFASQIVGNGERGQIVVGAMIATAGVIMAIITPILGTVLDKAGPKKPLAFASLIVMSICSILLIFVKPGMSAALPLGAVLLIIGYCSYTVAELMHNSMLPGAGAPKSLPLISGIGLAMGNGAGVFMLIAIAIIIGIAPFGLSAVDISRLSAPAVGVWILTFMGLFFVMMPDVYKPGATWKKAIADARNPKNRVNPVTWIKSRFREHPNVMRYLLGRMIYADATGAMFTIGGVYVTGVLGWQGQQLALIAIIGALPAVAGGFVGGFLDRTIGPKKALLFELSTVIVLFTSLISISPDAILFGLIPAGHVVWEGAVFNTLSDLAYVALTIPLGTALVASISSSRYMLVHIAPPKQIGEFFGFYAMAGSVTVWLGPGLVALITWLSGSQRVGFAAVAVLLVLGLAIISTVKADKTPTYLQTSAPD